ncbi:MAG: hypothetical protein RXN50_03315 [Sulfolobaceae archaeon]|nr:hypothetical protein [Sulfolobales archaeon]
MVAVSTLSLNGADLGRKAKMVPRFLNVTFGTADFDIPTIAIALLIVGLIVGLSTLILTIFAGATANAVPNEQPGTLSYNMTHPLVTGTQQFYGFYPTLYVLLGVSGIVLIAGGMISIIINKFKTS